MAGIVARSARRKKRRPNARGKAKAKPAVQKTWDHLDESRQRARLAGIEIVARWFQGNRKRRASLHVMFNKIARTELSDFRIMDWWPATGLAVVDRDYSNRKYAATLDEAVKLAMESV